MRAIILDLETTGKKEPQVVEAAWLSLSDPESLMIDEEYCQRYRPDKPIELGALATHHIMDEELTECPPSATFTLPLDTGYIIGHNVDYDWATIGKPEVKRICTLALCRSLFPDLDSHSLGAMLYRFNRTGARDRLRNAHNALEDCRTCLIILKNLLHHCGLTIEDRKTWETVWTVSEKARIPTVMTFGKHKGMKIKDVPWDYKDWLLKQTDVDPYLIIALKAKS